MNPKSNRIELFKGTPAGPAATPASGSAFDPAKVDKRSGPGAGSTGQSGANQALAGEAARKASGFNLSPMVRENLRLEEKERRIYEEKIKTEAKGVFDRARKDGFEQGYKEGLEAGKTAAYSDAAEEAKARLDSVEQCLHALETARSDLFKENEKFLIELVTQIAKRIVKKEVAADPEWIRRTFLEMIERIPLMPVTIGISALRSACLR
jgi:flagellar biosynthesis/type III secretory pathway protein FliH